MRFIPSFPTYRASELVGTDVRFLGDLGPLVGDSENLCEWLQDLQRSCEDWEQLGGAHSNRRSWCGWSGWVGLGRVGLGWVCFVGSGLLPWVGLASLLRCLVSFPIPKIGFFGPPSIRQKPLPGRLRRVVRSVRALSQCGPFALDLRLGGQA